ncbi:MAG TPA: protease pro-enzyme activation domain-containing protein [Candidatus Binataceae bacterium]|nr:protease pro-enzyme activation domain-containing protein [Candidatus Binataceae bacterium]
MIPAALAANVASVRLRGTPPAAEDLAEAGATSTLAPSSSMAMRVVMALRNQSELTQLLAEQQDPSSPEYHQWLTPEEFTARFGPTPEGIAQVSAWLTQQGFNVISADASSRLVRFTGTAAQAATAFQTSFAATPNGRYHANLVSPAVPANLASLIQSVEGLNNIRGFGVTPVPEVQVTKTKYAFGPEDMWAFYDESPLFPSIDGSGADCIALPEYAGYDSASVSLFDNEFGLPAPDITTVAVDGGGDASPSAETETLIDIEYSHTAAPETPIQLYVAGAADSNPETAFLDPLQQAVTDNACGSISLSIFVCPGEDSALANDAEAIYEQAATQGQTVFAAAGDDGAAEEIVNAKNNCVAGKKRGVIETAAAPYVVSVGGTEIVKPKYDKSDEGIVVPGSGTEEVWHEGIGAGGGGASQVFSKPAYQNGVTPADNARDIPDISLLAATKTPGYVFAQNDELYFGGGGTSFASPYWAGIAALIEQLEGGRLGGSFAFNTRLYSLASSNAAANGIRDVTKGINSFHGVKGFKAEPGYDQATGWGTPDILLFVQAYTGP